MSVGACVWACVYSTVHMCRSEDSFQELVLPLHHAESRSWTQVIGQAWQLENNSQCCTKGIYWQILFFILLVETQLHNLIWLADQCEGDGGGSGDLDLCWWIWTFVGGGGSGLWTFVDRRNKHFSQQRAPLPTKPYPLVTHVNERQTISSYFRGRFTQVGLF